VYVPTSPSVLPHITGSEKQIEVFLNQYVIDSMLHSLQDTDKLNLYINGNDTLNTSPLKLDTTSIGLFISALPDKYGEGKIMDISCNSTKVPSLNLTVNTSDLIYYPDCQFIVNVNNTYQETAFTASMTLESNLYLYLEKGFLKGEIKNINLSNLTVIQTNIGLIDDAKLKSFFNFAFSVGIPVINTMYFSKTGIALPSIQGLLFNDTDLFIQNGYVQVDMNPIFNQTTPVGNRRNLRSLFPK